jgi:hypothetical protein
LHRLHAQHEAQISRRVHLPGFADGETGSVILRAIDTEFEVQRQANDDRSPRQLRIDALAVICEQYLDRLSLGSNRPHVGVIGDVGTFTGRHVGLSETDTGIRLAPDTLRRIACDSFIYAAAVDASSAMLDMGRAVRSFTPVQRRAITVQYPTCAFPGCTIPAPSCRMHHLDWWDHSGATDLGNGIPLCRHHHHHPHRTRLARRTRPRHRHRHLVPTRQQLRRYDRAPHETTADPHHARERRSTRRDADGTHRGTLCGQRANAHCITAVSAEHLGTRAGRRACGWSRYCVRR